MSDAQKLRILVVGASGTLGRAIVDELKPRHEIIAAGIVAEFAPAGPRAAAIRLPRGLRINVVSPTARVEPKEVCGPYFRGFGPTPVARAAHGYSRSIEGAQTGQVYKVL